MNRLLRGWFTGCDNREYEIGRTLWALGSVALIAYQGWAIQKGQTFNPTEFGLAVAAILAAGGFGVAQKDRGAALAKTWSEPK